MIAVIDVGANTVRLHVARGSHLVYRERAMLRLGESIEQSGAIPDTKLHEAMDTVAAFARQARMHGAAHVEVLVTSPGRQAANGIDLIDRLSEAADAPARLLSADEEGRLGFLGAVSSLRPRDRRTVAVCDVGGGSTQITVGTRQDGPSWTHSIDLGSMRLTSRSLTEDPPGLSAVAAARDEVEAELAGVEIPIPDIALAVGGSARALRDIVGARLGFEEIDKLVAILARTPSRDIVEHYGIDRQRVRTLTAGAIIFEVVCERIGVALRVGRGGVREGALLEIERERAAA